MAKTRSIFCCGCKVDVSARLTNGEETYPHRKDLRGLPFWKCDTCGNFVGCHHKTTNWSEPLGCIPTPELKTARQHIHRLIDPLWKSGQIKRKKLYAMIADRLGIPEYHTAEIRTIEEARNVYRIASEIGARK